MVIERFNPIQGDVTESQVSSGSDRDKTRGKVSIQGKKEVSGLNSNELHRTQRRCPSAPIAFAILEEAMQII